MPLRKIKLPSDFDLLIKNSLASFTYPDHPEWDIQEDEKEDILEEIEAAKRYWPLIAILRLFSSAIRDILLGYIWEEEDSPAGIILYQRRSTGNYFINSISVLPAFRRRGIARKMLSAVLEEAKNEGTKKIRLDVISANLPARCLYENMGFSGYRNFSILSMQPQNELPLAAPIPHGYEEVSLKNKEWKAVYELNQRIVSEQVRLYDPPSPATYQQSGFQGFINWATGSRSRRMVLKEVNSGLPLGYSKYTCRVRKGGLNHMLFQLDPDFPGLAEYLIRSQLRQMLQQSPGRRTEINIPDNQPDLLEAALRTGFRKQQEYCRMGLLFE